MKPNPGGIIKGEAIVDREKEITQIWKALQNQSIIITSERRVGKTSILRKIESNPRDNWQPILYIVEGIEHPIEFVEGLYDAIIQKGILNGVFHNLTKLYNKFIAGNGINSWKFPQLKVEWKILLDSLIQDIHNAGEKVLIMLDELPVMLSTFKKIPEIGPVGTMVFLDTLRELRNKYEAEKKIAFIFCGSIGINLVLKDLKNHHGYNSNPINNMKIIPISSMEKQGASELCQKLTQDAPFIINNPDEVYDYIYEQTDGLPYYIQHIFDFFYDSNEKNIYKKHVDDAIWSLIDDSSDRGYFQNYYDRITTYYDEKQKAIALNILNKLCYNDDFLEETAIINIMNSKGDIDHELIKDTLELLFSDHYLLRKFHDNKRSYKFGYGIVQKWWKVNRGEQ